MEKPRRILKLTVAYDGTRFVGWQRQAEGVSIQGLLEEALAKFEGGPVTVFGAGRTDAGVHARGQVASAQVGFQHDLGAIQRGVNINLPLDVRVIAVEDAPAGFHARFSARAKSYHYVLTTAPVASPFERAFAWHLPERLDVEAMRTAAQALVGTHDFAAFQSAGTANVGSVRTITRSDVRTQPHPASHLIYEVEGNGFLRHMVRTIVGTLVEIGRGWRTVESMAALLDGRARSAAGPTAPAHGLFLVRVDYD